MSLLRILALTAVVAAAAPGYGQNILYQHNYGGAAGTPLHKQQPDVDNNGGGNLWQTRTDSLQPAGTGVFHYDDGAMTAGAYPGGAAGGQAMLGFTPESGNIYTATLRINVVDLSNTSEEWLGYGFVGSRFSGTGGQAQFFVDSNLWTIYRGDSATAPDQTFIGPATGGGQDWSSPVTPTRGGPIDLRIVLNTTNAAWEAEWLARVPTDPTFTSLRTATLGVNPTIHGVGYTVTNTSIVSADIEQFTLTTSGDVYAPGDVDQDGDADLDDLATIRANFGQAKWLPGEGDLNNDGTVNYADFRAWKVAYPLGSTITGLGIPEPSSAAIGLMGMAMAAGAARRRRRQT
jgi:MYXO-CTERM domain-containing protein